MKKKEYYTEELEKSAEEKMRSINNQKYYKVTTVPINNLQEAEDILKVIHKKGFNNAKLFIDRKIK